MRNLSRCEKRIAGFRPHPSFADFDYKFALESVKPLVLVVMQVACGSPSLMKRVFKNQKSVAVSRKNLEVDTAYPESPVRAEQVFTLCHSHLGRRRSASRILKWFVHWDFLSEKLVLQLPFSILIR